MEEIFVTKSRSRHKVQDITNLHHFRVELFYSIIDIRLQELNDRFDEVNTDLLLCMTCLSPNDSFLAFDNNRLIQFAKYYLEDFSDIELIVLDDQLQTYIIDVRVSKQFLGLKNIGDLAQKMVETKKNGVYPLVYRLITLALILPVVTATVERVFSAMNVIKN